LFRDAFERCIKHNTSLLSAALAFYSLLSLAPALYLLVAAAGVVIGQRAASGAVIDWATQMLGPGGGAFIGGVLERNGTDSSFATIAGVATLLYGATVAFGALQDALNLVWEVPPRAHGYIKQFFLKRLVSFVAVTIVAYVGIRVAAPFASPRAISTSCGRAYQAGCSMSTGGRSRTSFLARLSRIPSSAPVTALIGMATSLRPHKCPSWRST